MRELRTCDFCGTEPLGTFEIVPPELDPDEAEQRRVVLCGDCKALLGELIHPLLARAGTGSVESQSAAERSSTGGATGSNGADAGSTRTVTRTRTAVDGRGAQSNAGVETGGITGDGEDGTGGDAGAASVVDGGDTTSPARPGTDDRGTAGRDGITITTGDADRGRTEDGRGDGEDTSGDDRPRVVVNEESTSSTAESPPSTAESPPPGYRKVLRLLRNREFPIPRAQVEALAGGAYDLEDDQVEAILDYAIERDELAEDGNQLRLA